MYNTKRRIEKEGGRKKELGAKTTFQYIEFSLPSSRK
jgi:hypothetical protein